MKGAWEMKRMKKIFSVIFLLIIIIGCNSKPQITEKKALTLPAGYKLLCSVEGNKITIVFPNGRMAISTWNTKEEAINFINYFEKNKNDLIVDETTGYVWEECK